MIKVAKEFKNGARPDISFLPQQVQDFLQKCWAQDPASRPSFAELGYSFLSFQLKRRKFDYSIISKGSIGHSKNAALQMWQEFNQYGQTLQFVPWECFIQIFMAY